MTQDDDELTQAKGWVKVFGERDMVEVVGGTFDGQQGHVGEAWIDAKAGATQPISYVVHLDSGVTERFAHAQLRSLGRKRQPEQEA